MQSEKVEISLKLVKMRLRLRFDLRPRDYESQALTIQPRTLNNSQTITTNEAENRCLKISNATDRHYSKSATKKVTLSMNNFICELG